MPLYRRAIGNVPQARDGLGIIRLLLGFAQMAGAAFSLALLIFSGVSAPALVSVVATCLLTMMSVLLFGGRSH